MSRYRISLDEKDQSAEDSTDGASADAKLTSETMKRVLRISAVSMEQQGAVSLDRIA